MENRAWAAFVWIPMLLFVISVSCSSGETSANDYFDPLGKAASKYNSARDDVDNIIRDIDHGPPPGDRPSDIRVWLNQRVDILETAISDMNAASGSLGQQVPPSRLQPHQSATLRAWRAGTEATVIIRLYLLDFLETGRDDFSLIIRANRLFGEEDQFQLEARNVLEALR